MIRLNALLFALVGLAYLYVPVGLILFDGVAYAGGHFRALYEEASGRELLAASLLPAAWSMAVAAYLWRARRVSWLLALGSFAVCAGLLAFGYVVLAAMMLAGTASLAFAARRS